jgi:predicted ATPase
VEGGIDLVAVLTKLEAGIAMPRTVRQAILTRLARFDKPARDVLAAAAVLGRNCHYAELCQVSGVDELDGLVALDVLIAGEIFVATSDARRPYDFAHEKIRDVVYTEAGPARRRVLHRRALAALEQTAAPPGELAYHAERAELGEKARHYLQLAGDVVHTTVSVSDTLRWAMSAQVDIPPNDPRL